MRSPLHAFCRFVYVALQICVFCATPCAAQQFTAREVAVGRLFFFDPRVSADGSVACATCHQPERGMTDGRERAVGILGQVGQFNTPTIITAAYQPLQFWDGRTRGVDAQSLQPLTNPIEMGNDSVGQVMRRMNQIPLYRAAMRQVYGTPEVTSGRFARCIVAYEASLNSFNLAIDRRMAGYTRTLSPLAEHGFAVFQRAGCAACHVPPLYTDSAFHNNGIAWVSRDEDLGRLDVLPPDSDRTPATVRAFKTPTLRGIDRTAPYTHSGIVPNLETMVGLYSTGMLRDDRRRDRFMDPRVLAIGRMGLTGYDQRGLTQFLREAFTAPDVYRQGAPIKP